MTEGRKAREINLTDAMVQAGAEALAPCAFETDEFDNYLWVPRTRRDARKLARRVIIAALTAKAGKP